MARAQRAEGGAAGRLAARRRDTSRDGRQSARAPAPKRRGSSREGGGIKRGLRLVALMGLMGLIGFFVVAVVDVSASLVSRVHLGETTIGSLWDKVVDRVLDRDVPRLPDAGRGSAKPDRTRPGPARAARAPHVVDQHQTARAPTPAAPHPEEDARHVDRAPRPDPQVEQAKKRLDDLLKRL